LESAKPPALAFWSVRLEAEVVASQLAGEQPLLPALVGAARLAEPPEVARLAAVAVVSEPAVRLDVVEGVSAMAAAATALVYLLRLVLQGSPLV